MRHRTIPGAELKTHARSARADRRATIIPRWVAVSLLIFIVDITRACFVSKSRRAGPEAVPITRRDRHLLRRRRKRWRFLCPSSISQSRRLRLQILRIGRRPSVAKLYAFPCTPDSLDFLAVVAACGGLVLAMGWLLAAGCSASCFVTGYELMFILSIGILAAIWPFGRAFPQHGRVSRRACVPSASPRR